MKNIDYDVHTRNVLVKIAAWALSPVITRTLEEKMMYELADDLERAKTEANELAANLRVASGVSLSAQVGQLDVSGIYVGREHLTLLASSTGQAMLRINRAALTALAMGTVTVSSQPLAHPR